jgi:hypothetical protein
MRVVLMIVSGLFLTLAAQADLEAARLQFNGNVTAEVQVDEEDGDNALVIAGNVASNAIAIVDVGNFRLVVGVGGTTVNGRTFAFFSKDNLLDTFIDMGAGDDLVVVVSDIIGEEEFEAEGGDGEDTIRALGEISVEEGVELSGFETIIPEDLGT